MLPFPLLLVNVAINAFCVLRVSHHKVPRYKKKQRESFIENIASHSVIVILLCEMKWQFYFTIIIAEYLFVAWKTVHARRGGKTEPRQKLSREISLLSGNSFKRRMANISISRLGTPK